MRRNLARELELDELNPDRTFVVRCKASDFAIRTVLEQVRPDEYRTAHIDIRKTRLVPVSFCSRKLTGSELNWTPREKQTQAIIATLRQWAGQICFQPVIVVTDHRHSIFKSRNRVSHGQRGRRARWHVPGPAPVGL